MTRSGNGRAAGACWSAVAAVLQPLVARKDAGRTTHPNATWITWFGEVTPRSLRHGVLTVTVPNQFTLEWIRGHYAQELKAAVEGIDRIERVVVVYAGLPDWWWRRRPTEMRGRRAPRPLLRRVRARVRERRRRSTATRGRSRSVDRPRGDGEPDLADRRPEGVTA